tara:strand:- start:103 stop:396 length:294 start_codon:yes stop_codon:yes gene_type:complete
MEEIEKLYNVLVDQGLFDKTLDEFKVKFEESAYVDRVYDAVVDQGLFDKTKEDFTEKYSVKKKSKKTIRYSIQRMVCRGLLRLLTPTVKYLKTKATA